MSNERALPGLALREQVLDFPFDVLQLALDLLEALRIVGGL